MWFWWAMGCNPDDPAADEADAAEPPSENRKYAGCTFDRTTTDPSGVVTATAHREYDDLGWVASHEDDAVDPTFIDYGFAYVNDPFGNDLEYRLDVGLDGVAEQIELGEYDADGNPVRIEYDDDGDGSADFVATYVSIAGVLQSAEGHDDGDEVADYLTTYVHDAAGRRTEADTIQARNDRRVSSERQEWLADHDLLATRTWAELDGRGPIYSQAFAWSYDDQLRMIRASLDYDAFGEDVEVETADYVYDGDARLPATAHVVEDRPGDPLSETDLAWTYDDEWRLLEETNTAANGDVARETYVWDCP